MPFVLHHILLWKYRSIDSCTEENYKHFSWRALQLALNAWKTRSKLEPKIGKGKYVLAEYEKIKRITIPLDENHLLYITTEVGCDAHNLIDKVREL